MVAVGVYAAYDHVSQSALVELKTHENAAVVAAVASLKTRMEAIENERSHEELAELHKTLGEIKSAVAAAHDFSGALNQISQRVDRVEKDQGARLDKLGERIDCDFAARFAEIVTRLDKLERKPAAVAAASSFAPRPSPRARRRSPRRRRRRHRP